VEMEYEIFGTWMKTSGADLANLIKFLKFQPTPTWSFDDELEKRESLGVSWRVMALGNFHPELEFVAVLFFVAIVVEDSELGFLFAEVVAEDLWPSLCEVCEDEVETISTPCHHREVIKKLDFQIGVTIDM
jgi:hypothetical protein